MSICLHCNHDGGYVTGDTPAGLVHCDKCGFTYTPQHGPTSHETLRAIIKRLERIESVPRTRGDEPALRSTSRGRQTRSPHTRG